MMPKSEEEVETLDESGSDDGASPDGDAAAAAGGRQDDQAPPADGQQPQQQAEEIKDGLKPTPVVYISALMTFLFLLGTYDFLTSRCDQLSLLVAVITCQTRA